MIIIHKCVSDNVHYWYEGHAQSHICNGFSMLTCAFYEQLKREKRPCLKYVEERESKGIRLEISYEGNEGTAEEFYEGGIRWLTENHPDEVAFVIEYKDTSERR